MVICKVVENIFIQNNLIDKYMTTVVPNKKLYILNLLLNIV